MYIGVDIGGTKCAVSAADEGCNIYKKIHFATTSKEETLKNIIEAIDKLQHEYSPQAIGISCGGPLNSKEGVILCPPNLPDWIDIPICSVFEKKFGIPAYLQNDANACALAEWQFGGGRGAKNMLFLTFGTGLGSGIILDGRLYEGTNGNAGELGHIRLAKEGPVGFGKSGSFEGFCSGGGIAQLGKMKAHELFHKGFTPSFCSSPEGIELINAKAIAEAAEAGNEDALSIYELCGEYLGKGLAIIIDLLNPEKIIIGSIYTRSRKLLCKSMYKTLKEECIPSSLEVCEILPSMLGEAIGDIAAISVAINGIKKEN